MDVHAVGSCGQGNAPTILTSKATGPPPRIVPVNEPAEFTEFVRVQHPGASNQIVVPERLRDAFGPNTPKYVSASEPFIYPAKCMSTAGSSNDFAPLNQNQDIHTDSGKKYITVAHGIHEGLQMKFADLNDCDRRAYNSIPANRLSTDELMKTRVVLDNTSAIVTDWRPAVAESPRAQPADGDIPKPASDNEPNPTRPKVEPICWH